jgi:hypothetical protein
MRLYESAGFVAVGDSGPLRPGSTALAQAMELDLRAAQKAHPADGQQS